MINNFLTFSDGAKFAVVARNIINGRGFFNDFTFFGASLFGTNGIPSLIPYLISISFRIFGVTDFAVMAFSFTSYLLLGVTVFLLGRKLFNNFVGVISALAVLFNYDYIRYATSGASEPLFAFEIVLGMYLLSFKKIWINLLSLVVIGAMYFTRPQAFIFIAGLLFYWFLKRFGIKNGIKYFAVLSVLGILFDKFIIYPLSSKFTFLTPVIARGMQSILTYSSNSAVSDSLRGAASSTLGISDIGKKLFYNLYNFYKLMPNILNPYLFALFVIGILRKKNVEFKASSLFIVIITLLVTALSIPFYRYIHPVVPLIYIIAVGTLFEFVSNKVIFSLLVIFFCVGQTLGVLFLDSRFEAKSHNIGKPPVYVLLSQKLKTDTKSSDIVVTNLDTWGSWYGERKTIWFPLEPEMLKTATVNIDAIYLTDYKIDDANYYMGNNWRKIFDDPEKQKVLPEYKFSKEYRISAQETYENRDSRAILLIKK